MRLRKEIIESLYKGLSPMTQVTHYHTKALEAILEVMLDVRDLQDQANQFLFELSEHGKADR